MSSIKVVLLGATIFGCVGLHADTLYLRSGGTVSGTFVSGDNREVRFTTDRANNTRTYPLSRVERIEFSDMDRSGFNSGSSSSSLSNDDSRFDRADRADRADRVGRNDRRDSFGGERRDRFDSARDSRYTVPEGTTVTVRMIDAIDSNRDAEGQTFRASLDDAIVVNGTTVARQGSDATVRVVRVDQGRAISGKEEVAVELASLNIDGRTVDVMSNHAAVAAKSRGSSNVKVIGGTAVLGAIIGAVAGGGKGAAIGAASGAGAGAAIQTIRGQRVQIPSESKLDFSLSQPLYVR